MKTNRFSSNQSMGKDDIISDKIDLELMINPDELNEELMNQPMLMRKYTKLKAEVNEKAKTVELRLKEMEARYYLEHSKQGHKVKDVESLVALEPEVQKLKRELIEAERLLDTFEGIVRSVSQRHEMLKDISANIRKEIM